MNGFGGGRCGDDHVRLRLTDNGPHPPRQIPKENGVVAKKTFTHENNIAQGSEARFTGRSFLGVMQLTVHATRRLRHGFAQSALV